MWMESLLMWYGTLLRCILDTQLTACLLLCVWLQSDEQQQYMGRQLIQHASQAGVFFKVCPSRSSLLRAGTSTTG